MPIKPAPGRTAACPELHPFQHDQPKLRPHTAVFGIAQQFDLVSGLQAESDHSAARFGGRKSIWAATMNHRGAVAKRLREFLLICRRTFQHHPLRPLRLPDLSAAVHFTSAPKQASAFP